MSDFQPDPRTPPNVGGPLDVLLKWLDAFLTVIDNVYLKLKSWVRRKGSKSSRRGSKRFSRSSKQPMMEQAYTTQTSQPASTAYARKARPSTESRQLMSPAGRTVSPVSPVSGTFSSSDHSHGAPVAEASTYDRVHAAPPQAYVPSSNNAYAVAMAKPDEPHPHASPKAAPAPARHPEAEPVLAQPKPRTQVSRLVSEEAGTPARSNSTCSRVSTDSRRSSTDSPWRPAGPYRSPEQRHSGAFSAHSGSGAPSVTSSQALGHARVPSHGSLAAIAAGHRLSAGRLSGEHERARYDAVRPLSPQFAPSPAQRSVSPQYGRADTPSYNDFASRPTSPPQQAQHWEPAVPTTTGPTGAKYAHVTTGRTGTKYAHVSADALSASSPTSPTASSWHMPPAERHDGYNGGWNAVGAAGAPGAGVDVEDANRRWSAHSGAAGAAGPNTAADDAKRWSAHSGASASQRTRSTFGAQQPAPPAQPVRKFVPGKAYAPPPEDTASVSDFSDESLYDVPNPTAGRSTTAQSYAAAYAANLKRRTASLRSSKSKRSSGQAGTPTWAQTYLRRSEMA